MGYVKDQVCQPPISLSLRERILQAITNADELQLQRALEEFEYRRVDISRATNLARIRHL